MESSKVENSMKSLCSTIMFNRNNNNNRNRKIKSKIKIKQILMQLIKLIRFQLDHRVRKKIVKSRIISKLRSKNKNSMRNNWLPSMIKLFSPEFLHIAKINYSFLLLGSLLLLQLGSFFPYLVFSYQECLQHLFLWDKDPLKKL